MIYSWKSVFEYHRLLNESPQEHLLSVSFVTTSDWKHQEVGDGSPTPSVLLTIVYITAPRGDVCLPWSGCWVFLFCYWPQYYSWIPVQVVMRTIPRMSNHRLIIKASLERAMWEGLLAQIRTRSRTRTVPDIIIRPGVSIAENQTIDHEKISHFCNCYSQCSRSTW